MADSEAEMFKLGIPVKTRHNEVAPEPVRDRADLRGQRTSPPTTTSSAMDVMRRTAEKYGLVCLLHEKPFAGINGSGKHNNWSMSTDGGENLLNPGDNPHAERAVPRVLRRGDSGRGEVPGTAPRQRGVSAGNDHRLGANEAPPAIVSASSWATNSRT